jgi:hypothetical protein
VKYVLTKRIARHVLTSELAIMAMMMNDRDRKSVREVVLSLLDQLRSINLPRYQLPPEQLQKRITPMHSKYICT